MSVNLYKWQFLPGVDQRLWWTSSSIYSIFLFRKMCAAVANRQKRKAYTKWKYQNERTRERRTFGPRSLGSSSSTLHNSLSAPLRKSLFSRCIAPLQGNHKILSDQDTLITYPRTSKAVIPCETSVATREPLPHMKSRDSHSVLTSWQLRFPGTLWYLPPSCCI